MPFPRRRPHFTIALQGNLEKSFIRNSLMHRFSEYRIMWVMCLFDLPTETKVERKRHSEFRKNLLRDGFKRFQLSIYMRHCFSAENATVHVNRVQSVIPPKGKVAIFCITDRQFEKIQIFYGKKGRKPLPPPTQLEIF